MQTNIEDDIKTIDSFILSLGVKYSINIDTLSTCYDLIEFYAKGSDEKIQFSMKHMTVRIKNFAFNINYSVFLALDRLVTYLDQRRIEIDQIKQKWDLKVKPNDEMKAAAKQ